MSRNTNNPYDPIEAISSSKKQNPYAKWENLYDTNHYLNDVHALEIEDILLEVCSKDRALQLGRKYLHLDARALTQSLQGQLSEEKAKLYQKTTNLYLETANVACQIASLTFGQGFVAIGQAFTATASHSDRTTRSLEETLNHHSQCKGNLHNDQTQQTRSAEEQLKQIHDLMDRLNQNSRRQAEMVVGG